MSGLSPLEVASGLVLGTVAHVDLPARGSDPRAAMERALLEPLRRGPCLVSFSGGRDSSAVLAVATSVARREGLPLPIPATLRFPSAEAAAESEWQESVVAHLGLSDWIRLEMTDELDCVGPVASASLARHGLLWPSNAHFHAPLFAEARDGSFLTGIGGDELLGSSRWWHARRVLAGQVAPRPRDGFALALALAAPRLRRLVTRRRMRAPFPWLHDRVVTQLERQLANDEAAEPFGWRGGILFNASHRYLHVGTRSLAILAAAENVSLTHPFLEPDFVSALASLPRADRFSTRRGAMDAIFGDVLPADVRSRQTKASFDGAFWHAHSRELVGRWAGEGVDASLVDVERLRARWESGSPDPRTYTLLQSVKLALDLPASARQGIEQPVSRLVEPVPASRPAELPAR